MSSGKGERCTLRLPNGVTFYRILKSFSNVSFTFNVKIGYLDELFPEWRLYHHLELGYGNFRLNINERWS